MGEGNRRASADNQAGFEHSPHHHRCGRQILNARLGTAMSLSPRERQAREAKLQQQIDEAEMTKNERAVQEGQLASVSMMRDWAADIFTRLVQMIKQSRLSVSEQKRWIEELRDTKFEPSAETKAKYGISSRA